MTELQNKVLAYVTPKLLSDLMRSFTKEEIENRSWRKILVSTISFAFCARHNIEKGSNDSMIVLQLVYALIFDSFVLVISEAITNKYKELGFDTSSEDEVFQHLHKLGCVEVKEHTNVHHLSDYIKPKGLN